MQVCCHGNKGAYGPFTKLFDFLEIPTAAHYKSELVMSNFNGDINIVSTSLIGLGKVSNLLSNIRTWKKPP